ncbi:hypothetical protein N9219_02860 [bacterium]|nr:hypothetical protein [bacterium]
MVFENIKDCQMIYAIICDCPFIAAIHNSAKLWVAHTEYTISKKSIAGEIVTIWDCRYDRGIPKKWKVSEFGHVYSIGTF